jgi:hypothetical protein
VDVLGTVTAVAPDGTVRWQIAGAGGKGLAVGPDGTVYAASSEAVRAFAADGSPRWTFVQDPRALVLLGLALGPDGNLYAVASSGLGVFSLAPDGRLRWATPEPYDRPNVLYGELVFGPGPGGGLQLCFHANRHLRGLTSDGEEVFSIVGGDQPAVSPLDGSVHQGDASYRPDGTLAWRAGLFVGAPPALGPDGTTYVPFLQSALVALDPAGRERWRTTSPDWLGNPDVAPGGATLLVTGSEPSALAATLQAFGRDGARLWRLAFPELGGGRPSLDGRIAFTPDASRAYLVLVATGADGPRAWLVAVGLR